MYIQMTRVRRQLLSSCLDLVDDWLAMLQMQSCSINKHMVDEVKQREKETEMQMQRRKKALDESHMDAQLKQLSKQISECSARASALRKVRTGY